MKKIKFTRKTWIILGVVAAVLAIIVIVIVSNARKQALALQASMQTVALERGTLTALVGATGTVRANQSAVLTWQTTGKVASVDVQPGDLVTAGQILARLEPASLSQNIILAQADLVSAQRALDDLLTSDLARAQAYQAMVAAQKNLDDARDKLESKSYGRASQETLDIARANLIIAEDGVTRATQLYDQFDSLDEDNPMRAEAFSQLAAARQQYNRALANLNYLLGLPDQTEVAGAGAAVEVAEAVLENATREYERLKDGPDPADIAAAEARVAAVQATLDLAVIKAPFAGTVTDSNPLVGDQVSPGTTAFRVDDLSRLMVDVQVTEVDINRIQVGQQAAITFDAIQDVEYHAIVTEVGRVGVPFQGVVNFSVTLELTDPDASVRPGMTAAVNITVSQLENVLIVPNRSVRLVDGQYVVFVMRDKLPVAVNVTIGATSDTYSQIIAGDVKEGDLIIINPPASLTSFGGPSFMMGGGGG